MTSPVHTLIERIEAELGARPVRQAAPLYLIGDEVDWYEAMTSRRLALGLTQARAEELAGLTSERHLSKIEPVRLRDGRARAYTRRPFRLSANETAWALMGAYDMVLTMLPAWMYDAIEAMFETPALAPSVARLKKSPADAPRASEATTLPEGARSLATGQRRQSDGPSSPWGAGIAFVG